MLDWLEIRMMCPNGATYLHAYSVDSELVVRHSCPWVCLEQSGYHHNLVKI